MMNRRCFPVSACCDLSWCALMLGWFFSASAVADVRLPNIFSDHMVLQRDQPLKIWGQADADEEVQVRIGQQQHTTVADAEGNWTVTLQPLTLGDPLTLQVRGKNTITLDDILVGEVWVCSGQSNMAWTVGRSQDVELEVLAANYPNVRTINFPRVGRQQPVWSHEDCGWIKCSPETVREFSAVGYFFGRQLHQSLNVPIGLINNSWGGAAAEAFLPVEALQDAPELFGPLLKHWEALAATSAELGERDDLTDNQQEELKAINTRLAGQQRPANIYHGVLASHRGYGIRGAIWYQGESNAGRAYQYRELFPRLISHWRNVWGQGDFPFYWVQLADFRSEASEPGESSWAELREAQTMVLDRLPNTGQAVIIDRGEARDIHPRDKYTVGRRLARIALARDYGFDLHFQSPRYQSMERDGKRLILSFDHVGDGWRAFDVPEPVGFSIAGEDRQFHWAMAKILPDRRIAVSSQLVPDPVAVRYGWAENPVVNLYNQHDLPLTPFRTDDWPGITQDER